MVWVISCWMLSMVSGLRWARVYTAALTCATLIVAALTQPSLLMHASGWVQLAVFALTPWLLAAQQEQELAKVRALHAQEAEMLAHLSGAARSLLLLQNATQQMESQIAEITDLYRITKETVRALHLPELFGAVLPMAPRFLDARALRLIDSSGSSSSETETDSFHALRATRIGGEFSMEPESRASDLELAIARKATATPEAGSATGQELGIALPEGVSTVSWVPLWRDQKVAGVLVADELAEPHRKTLAIVGNQLSLQLSRILLYRQVESLAVTDALTGLSVRSHFLERAREELARSKRHGLGCTLVMADLDLFKQKNDTYGHLVGDVVLRDVAKLLQRNLREIDMIARFGGEEFILMLIETPIAQAMPIAQRLKQLVEVHPIRAYDELLTQTISMGVAGFPDHAQTLEQLIERADQALYAAKHAGRNRVIQWGEKLDAA